MSNEKRFREFLLDMSDEELELFARVLSGRDRSPFFALLYYLFKDDFVTFLNTFQDCRIDVPEVSSLSRLRERIQIYKEWERHEFDEAYIPTLEDKYGRYPEFYRNVKSGIEKMAGRALSMDGVLLPEELDSDD